MMKAATMTCRRLCRMKFSNIFLGFCCIISCLVLYDYIRHLRTSTDDSSSASRPRGHRIDVFPTNKQICTHPKVSEDALAGTFHKMPPLRCGSRNSLMYLEDGIVQINQTILEERTLKKCIYRAIEFKTDRGYQYSKPHVRSKPPFSVKIKHDLFRVECFINKTRDDVTSEILNSKAVLDFDADFEDKVDYDQFFAQVVPKDEAKKRIEPGDDKLQKMNVLVMPIDSMSDLSYQRKLPKTYAYLRDRLNAVFMKGQSIVGDGATANILALTAGHQVDSIETRRDMIDSTYVDKYPFIWYDFERAGYATLYAEDGEPSIGTFQMRLNGFEQEPTDHYLRPFWLAAWGSQLQQKSPRFCLGDKPKHRYLLSYIRDFFQKYPKTPKFAFVFPGELSHQDVNAVEFMDQDLVDLLESLKTGEQLKNTLVIMGGDHGTRYSQVRHTSQGRLDERLPMMALAFPPWFRQKYPNAIRRLERNAHTMTTPYDVYETLRDVLDPSRLSQPIKPRQRGMSLLRTHPMNRTCSSAGIDVHYCTCAQQTVLKTTDEHVLIAAKHAVRFLNEQLKVVQHLCAELVLGKIIEATEITPNELVLAKSPLTTSHLTHLQITFHTAPNHAIFEATVDVDKSSATYVTVGVSRTNKYGTEPQCIAEKWPELRRFCYCRNHRGPS